MTTAALYGRGLLPQQQAARVATPPSGSGQWNAFWQGYNPLSSAGNWRFPGGNFNDYLSYLNAAPPDPGQSSRIDKFGDWEGGLVAGNAGAPDTRRISWSGTSADLGTLRDYANAVAQGGGGATLSGQLKAPAALAGGPGSRQAALGRGAAPPNAAPSTGRPTRPVEVQRPPYDPQGELLRAIEYLQRGNPNGLGSRY